MDMWLRYESYSNLTNVTGSFWNTTTSSNPIDMASRLFTVIQFSIIGSLGIISNILPVLVTLIGYVKRDAVTAMVVNISFCELLLCSSFVFGQSFFVLWREWLAVGWCHFLSFLHFTAAFASFMFPPLLAVNRYIALYRSFLYDQAYTKRKVILLLAGCWSFCAVVPFAFLLAGKTGFDEDNDHCCMVVKDATWIVLYWVTIIIPLLTFCDGVTIYCNYKIYVKLNNHAKEATMVANVVKENQEILYFLLADMLFPICFQSVYHIFKFILVNRTSEFLKRFFISLYLVNSILRGLVTILMLRPYRRAVLRLLFRNRAMNAVHPTSGLTEFSKGGTRPFPGAGSFKRRTFSVPNGPYF